MSATEANIADTSEGVVTTRFIALATAGFCFYLYLSFVGTLPFQPRSLLLYSVTPDSDVVKQSLSLAAFGMILPALLYAWRPGHSLVPTAVVLALTWCGLTLFWSGTPWIGARRFAYTILSVVVVFGYARYVGPALLLRVLALFLAAIVVISLVAGIFVPGAVHPADDPEFGIAGSWRGLMLHKNDAGLVAAASGILASARLSTEPRFAAVGIFLASLALLFLSAAKTSIILLPVALLLGWTLYILAIKMNRLTVLAIGTWVILLLAVMTSLEWAEIGELIEDPRSFTGRSAIWAALMAVARGGAWLFGTGFASLFGVGGDTPLAPYLSEWIEEAGHGHNGYLELLVSTGIPGLVLAIFAFFLKPLWQLLGGQYAGERAMLTCLLLFLAFHNMFETSLMDRARIGWILLLVVAAAAHFSSAPVARSKAMIAPS